MILIIHSFTKRRKNLCLECCNGRPGLITWAMQESICNKGILHSFLLYSPVNLLHTGRYRLVYAIIFGAMSNVFLSLVLDKGGFCTSGSVIGRAFCNQGEYFNTACIYLELLIWSMMNICWQVFFFVLHCTQLSLQSLLWCCSAWCMPLCLLVWMLQCPSWDTWQDSFISLSCKLYPNTAQCLNNIVLINRTKQN